MWITTMSTYNLLLVILLAAIATGSTSSDHYLLSCGASSSVAHTPSTYDGRTWYSDNNSTFSNDFSSTTVAAAAAAGDVNVPQIPFSAARIFTSNFTYSFPVSSGPKFIRLFFYPPSSNSSSSDSYLTVESNSGHLLLRNFSAYLATSTYMFKEFYVRVNTSLLQLTFSPTSPSPHAFLNGIEIVSVPENLYVGHTAPKHIAYPSVEFDLANSTALETAYRLNVGGSEVGSEEDSGNMYRQWENDDNYLMDDFYGLTGLLENQTLIKYASVTPNYSAPGMVYQTFREMGIYITDEQKMRMNMTWGFEVDLGFYYLLRLHWCEDVVNVNAGGDRVFDVYIDQLTAEEGVDVFAWVGGRTAVFGDYVVYMDAGGSGNGGRGVLQLAMHPTTPSRYADILLNGLEVFKLSRPDGSLDAPNPDRSRPRIPAPNQQPPPNSPFHTSNVFIITSSVVGSILVVVALVVYYLFVRRGQCCFLESADPNSNTSSSKKTLITIKTKTGISSPSSSSSSSSPQCRIFMLSDIRSATSDFSDASIIGKGGFGIVYVGTLDGSTTDHGPIKVAIKRLKPSSKQGSNEFRTEIEMLSNLRHEHLVGLIGYCDEQGEMILVYEYMKSGTLRDRLYDDTDSDSSPLSWSQRLEVCVGAAKGLRYLHEGGKHKIIHRDIKSSNILLDDRLVAKVSDFGLSKLGSMSEEGLDHISTRVKGSLGYVDPEYIRRRQLTEKSDVYSLGVVLFEVLCGRPAVNPNLPKEQMNLAIWARSHQKRGRLEDVVDPKLKGQIEPECLRMYGEIAERCVRNNGVDRPSAAEVLQALLNICLKEAKNDGEKA